MGLISAINLSKLAEGGICAAAVYRLPRYGYTLANVFLSLFQNLDAESRIGKHHILLCLQSRVLQYGIENLSCLILIGSTNELFGSGIGKAKVGRTEHLLVAIGSDLEVASEAYLVIAVDTVHDAIVNAQFLVHLTVQAHLVEIGHTQQLALGLRWIY